MVLDYVGAFEVVRSLVFPPLIFDLDFLTVVSGREARILLPLSVVN